LLFELVEPAIDAAAIAITRAATTIGEAIAITAKSWRATISIAESTTFARRRSTIGKAAVSLSEAVTIEAIPPRKSRRNHWRAAAIAIALGKPQRQTAIGKRWTLSRRTTAGKSRSAARRRTTAEITRRAAPAIAAPHVAIVAHIIVTASPSSEAVAVAIHRGQIESIGKFAPCFGIQIFVTPLVIIIGTSTAREAQCQQSDGRGNGRPSIELPQPCLTHCKLLLARISRRRRAKCTLG
jgi:hypothetical protein